VSVESTMTSRGIDKPHARQLRQDAVARYAVLRPQAVQFTLGPGVADMGIKFRTALVLALAGVDYFD
jgi:hypothetical protein